MTLLSDGFSFDAVVAGPSARMRAVFDAARAVSAGDSPVVITGETGTGKELLARVIHDASTRRRGPFVATRCTGAPEAVLGSVLLDHDRGASRGPGRDRQNLFDSAAGGTLLLEGIDTLPPVIQTRLARALRDRHVERLEGGDGAAMDVRLMATSQHDLGALVAQGRFDQDLHLQLSVVTIAVPPLRERREDILPLARHFLAAACRRRDMPVPNIGAHIEDALLRYRWPGNVRELENACERMAETCTCGTVRTGCLEPQIVVGGDPDVSVPIRPNGQAAAPLAISLDERLHVVEAQLIAWALRVSGGNKSRAATLLRIKRTTLADRITRHGPELLVAAGLPTEPPHQGAVERSPS